MYQVWADNKTSLACWFFFSLFTQLSSVNQGRMRWLWSFSHSPPKTQDLLPQERASLGGAPSWAAAASLPWTAFMVPVFPMQCKDQCKWSRHDRPLQNSPGAKFSFQTLGVPLPGYPCFTCGVAEVALVQCCTYCWESANGRIVPNWC